MTTWSDLLTWDPEPLRQASAELTMTARRIYTVADDIGNARPSGDEWSGKSADAARRKLSDLSNALGELASQIDKTAQDLDTDAAQVDRTRNNVRSALDYAASCGLTITAEGSVVAPPTADDAASVHSDLDECARLVQRAIDAAAEFFRSSTCLQFSQAVRSFLFELGKALVQDHVAQRIAEGIASAIAAVTPSWAGAGALVGGGVATVSIPDPALVKAAGGFLKFGAVGIGAAIDFTGQMQAVRAGQQDVGDAVIKTAAHTGIGIGSAVAAGAIMGSVFPGVGTVVGALGGAVVGSVLSIAGSGLFDAAYDALGGWKGIGNAILGRWR